MLQRKEPDFVLHTYEECPELCSNLKITKKLCNSKINFTWKISNTTVEVTHTSAAECTKWWQCLTLFGTDMVFSLKVVSDLHCNIGF